MVILWFAQGLTVLQGCSESRVETTHRVRSHQDDVDVTQ
jgi:hypothetical protein